MALLPPTWKAFWGLIGYGGSIDFLVERSKDPSWLRLVMESILNSPAWTNLPLIAMGLLFIWWDVARRAHTQAMEAVAAAPLPLPPVLRVPKAMGSATPQEREFVPRELTPARLFSFYDNLTQIQAFEITREYIGKWMTVRGKVNNIRPWTGTFSQVTLERPPEIGKISDHAMRVFPFPRPHED